MELDPQPEEIMSMEVELGCESWTSFVPFPPVPVPNKHPRFCGRKAIWSRSGCECALNVRLTPLQKQRLTKHKRAVRALAQKGRSLRTKKALLQKGGILGALLGPVLSVLGTALFR